MAGQFAKLCVAKCNEANVTYSYTTLSPIECSQCDCEGWFCIFLHNWLNCGLGGWTDAAVATKRVSVSRHRSLLLI